MPWSSYQKNKEASYGTKEEKYHRGSRICQGLEDKNKFNDQELEAEHFAWE